MKLQFQVKKGLDLKKSLSLHSARVILLKRGTSHFQFVYATNALPIKNVAAKATIA